jgi:hypothetical protein
MLRLGVPARAVASRLRLEGLTPATYEAALLGFSAQKAAAAASGSPLHPKRPARQRPLLLATLRNGDEGAGGGSAQAEAESVEEKEGPGQDRANHGAGSRGSSAAGPLLLVRVRRNASADSFSPDDVLVFVMQPFTFFEFPRDVRFCVTATIFLVVYSNTHCFSSYIFLFMFLIFFFNFFLLPVSLLLQLRSVPGADGAAVGGGRAARWWRRAVARAARAPDAVAVLAVAVLAFSRASLRCGRL